MRSWLHLALWGAVFLGACSSGGPGGLISFQSVHEGAGSSLESPGTSTGGQAVGESETPNGNNTDPKGGRDASTQIPDVNIPDINIPDIKTQTETGSTDAGGATCSDLQACCDSLDAGTQQTQCQTIVDNGDDSVCSQALSSAKQSGACE